MFSGLLVKLIGQSVVETGQVLQVDFQIVLTDVVVPLQGVPNIKIQGKYLNIRLKLGRNTCICSGSCHRGTAAKIPSVFV